MALIDDEAVVLGRLDYSESSQILVLFTRHHGKVRAIAKGIRRGTRTRFAVGIDLLDVGKVVLACRPERGSQLATVVEWQQTRCFLALRTVLSRIHAATYAAEVTAQLTEEWDSHHGLFDALITMLMQLSDTKEPLRPVVAYQLAVLKGVGSFPRLEGCIHCGRTADLTHFSSSEGGWVCRHCEPGAIEKLEVRPSTVRTLKAMADLGTDVHAATGPADPPQALAGAFGVLNYHIAHLMARQPRLASKLVPARKQRVQETRSGDA